MEMRSQATALKIVPADSIVIWYSYFLSLVVSYAISPARNGSPPVITINDVGCLFTAARISLKFHSFPSGFHEV